MQDNGEVVREDEAEAGDRSQRDMGAGIAALERERDEARAHVQLERDIMNTMAHEVPSLLRGDPGRIRQVLLNLAGNAVKFTASGGVVMRVDRVEESEGQVRLRFAVADTGIGMTDEQRGRLFQAFEQADASIARR